MIVDPERFKLLTSEDALTTYQFHTRTAKHYFCRYCGIHSYYIPRSHPGKIEVNMRCLEGVLASLTVEPFNGREWEKSIHTLLR